MIHGEGEYYEYIGGCSVHRRVTMMHVEGYYDSCRGYLEHIGICNISQRLLLICSPS